MLIKPDGSLLRMESMLPYFQVLPFADILFQDYTFPGISLIIVNGVSNLTAAVLILCKKRIGYALGTVFGFTLMLWIIIQFVIFPANVLSTLYFIFGVLQNFGFARFLYVWAFISVNLAVFNLLPFPGLDGWQLLVTFVEAATRKKIPDKVKNIVSLIGLGLLLLLMGALVVKDVARYFFMAVVL